MAQVKRFYASRFRRRVRDWGGVQPKCFFGSAHAGQIRLDLLQRLVARRGPVGLTEIAFHPGQARSIPPAASSPTEWEDPLAELRPSELELLTSPALAAWLAATGVHLGRLAEITEGAPPPAG